jgi:hypothetical protein
MPPNRRHRARGRSPFIVGGAKQAQVSTRQVEGEQVFDALFNPGSDPHIIQLRPHRKDCNVVRQPWWVPSW